MFRGCNMTSGGYRMINSFEIERYRCFSRVSAGNLSRVNIIVGQSGTGKTALLEALFLGAGGSPSHYFTILGWRGVLAGGQFTLSTQDYDQFFRDMFHNFNISSGTRISINDNDRGSWTLEIGPDADVQEELLVSQEYQSYTPIAFIHSVSGHPPAKMGIKVNQEGDLKLGRSPHIYHIASLNNSTMANPNNVTGPFSQMITSGTEKDVIAAMTDFYGEVNDVRLVAYAGGNVLLADVKGLGRIPVNSVSGGLNKYLTLLVTLGHRHRNVVLMDEIENGFYYASLTKAWKGIVAACRRTESQIFFTTHSRECLMALLPILEENPDDFTLIRTEKLHGEIVPVQFSGDDMRASLKQDFEIR